MNISPSVRAHESWSCTEVLGWRAMAEAGRKLRNSMKEKGCHDKSLCHHAHKAGAEQMLLWRFQSGSGLVFSIFSPGLMRDSTARVRLASDSGSGGTRTLMASPIAQASTLVV